MALHRFYESEAIAKEYIQFRPTYNGKIRSVILNFLEQNCDNKQAFDIMVDVGCGSGQSTNFLAPCFKKVLATDVSPKQIELAVAQNKFDHVTYELGRAEDIKVEDHSVDLLLSATSAHWFDLPKFYKEAARVLKPNGSLVIMGYKFPILTPISSGKFRSDLTEYATNLFESCILFGGKYNVSSYKEVCSKYPSIFAEIPTTNKHKLDEELIYPNLSLTQAKGYLLSNDSVQNYREFKANEIRAKKGYVTEEDMKSFDVTERFEKEMQQKLGLKEMNDDTIKFQFLYEVYIQFAHGLTTE